ncbi:MAG: helix-turn-helix transcriptional regulator [Clostridia bacterium]|nr:helix-turn-helix transcriptional regulator [Clostridia bacterium]
MQDIGQELKAHREAWDLTQTKLADATGISQQKISYYESGKHSPPIEDCILLADFYGITLDELVGRKMRKY